MADEPEALGFYVDSEGDVWKHNADGTWLCLRNDNTYDWGSVEQYAPLRRVLGAEQDARNITVEDGVREAFSSLTDALQLLPGSYGWSAQVLLARPDDKTTTLAIANEATSEAWGVRMRGQR